MAERTTGHVDTFDYVIVGAGSAGCVLANRLSEDGKSTVCLIEAGRRATGLFVDMPAAMMQTLSRPELAWGFRSEPEPFLNGRQYNVMRGKTLGGSSQINGMGYVRGDRHDYDDWAALGCTGWDYEDVVPYFKRAEASWEGESELRGGSGPLSVVRSLEPALRFEDFRDAAANAGYRTSDRIEDDARNGLAPNELTVARDGRRCSTWHAYLRPAMKRPNLHVVSGAHGRRVILDGRRAAGFEYDGPGAPRVVLARREVILCAGAFCSPQLLMLSGIGPADELLRAGIAPVHNLPGVGQNLREHPVAFGVFAASGDTFADELRLDRAILSVLRWLAFGTGPFATNASPAQLFCHTDPNWNRADIQISFLALDARARPWIPFLQRPIHGFTSLVAGLRSDSQGRVSLRSPDPREHPRILYRLLSEQSDVDRMIRGLRVLRKIFAAEPLRGRVIGEALPGADCETNEALTEFLRANCVPDEHPVGTCKMGRDAAAVVDPLLRVHGIAGLRVVDASIMPTVPTGNTNGPVIMIAEKAADHIRGG